MRWRAAQRARAALPEDASPSARFLAATAIGMAHVIGGAAEAGAQALREAVAIARNAPDLADDPRLRAWLVLVPVSCASVSRAAS